MHEILLRANFIVYKNFKSMTLSKLQNQEKSYAQLAGLLYLIIAIIGGFSIGYIPDLIVVKGDAGQTFQNLIKQQELFRWAIVGDILVLLIEILLTVMLYQLFKAYHATGIQIATYTRFGMSIIMGVNLLNYMVPALIMNQASYLNTFSSEQLESLTFLFFKLHKYGELTWQIFFAVHLFSLAYVLRKVPQIPKGLATLMLIGSLAYAGDSFIQLTFINSDLLSALFSILLIFAVVAELWFAFWLLIKGMKIKAIKPPFYFFF